MGECQRRHFHLGGKVDGCRVFEVKFRSRSCKICGCHRNYRRMEITYKTKTVYTKCHKIHDFEFQSSVDGCQEFKPKGRVGTPEYLTCALCGCDRGFHHNEITVDVTKYC